MTANELANGLTSALKSYIRERGFYASGRLFNSVNFQVTDEPFDVKLNALEYIQYLDDGKFLIDFYNLPKVEQLFLTYIDSRITSTLNEIEL